MNENEEKVIFNLIDSEYLKLNNKYKEPSTKLKIKLSKLVNLSELLYNLEQYKNNSDYNKLKNYWLLKYYNFLCSKNVETKISTFPFVKNVATGFSKSDVKIGFDYYDVKLTNSVRKKRYSFKEITEINDLSKQELRIDVVKSLYNNLKGNDYNENRIYVLLCSKSNNEIEQLRAKSDFKLINQEINKYFCNFDTFKKYVFKYLNNNVLVIPIIVD